MEWKRPRDGQCFVGFLAGSRRDTREQVKKTLWERYGIKIIFHIGKEQEKDSSWTIPGHCEVVVILSDDIADRQLQQVLTRAKLLSNCPNVGISYKERNQPQKWDVHFAGNGFSCPPKWRDGILIPNIADKKTLEEERKAELAAIEETRTAWVDPALKEGPKLGDAVADVLNKYKPTLVKEEPKKKDPDRKGMGGPKTVKVGEMVPAPPGFPAAVRAARERMGLSQGQFGAKLGTAQSGPSSWERGAGVPSYELWLKLHALCPDIPEPPGIKGKKAYDKRHENDPKPKTAKEAFSGASPAATPAPQPAAVPPPPVPEMVAPTPPPPPPVVVAAAPAPAPVAMAAPQGESVTICLRSGGTLTLSASVSLLRLKGEDRLFVFEMIDKLQSYEEKKE